jgi:hypothetical protein
MARYRASASIAAGVGKHGAPSTRRFSLQVGPPPDPPSDPRYCAAADPDSAALWSDFRPKQFQFDICPDSNCWHTNQIFVRDANTPLTVKLPSTPCKLARLPDHEQTAMDHAIDGLGPACFRGIRSPALQACRYLSLFCVKELSTSACSAAEAKKFILGSTILVRLSQLLWDALALISRCERNGGQDQRETGLAETAHLYFGLNGARWALERGKVRPMIVSFLVLSRHLWFLQAYQTC